jgi:hypothetical protein
MENSITWIYTLGKFNLPVNSFCINEDFKSYSTFVLLRNEL